MDPSLQDVHELCGDLRRFSTWVFEGCMHQVRTRQHLGTCVEARLHDGRRKTHQPAGLRLAHDASDADALRQRINRCYLATWDDEAVASRLQAVFTRAVPDAHYLLIDDTGIEKKGDKSPGVRRQYTGTAGKITNCQVVVSSHLASTTTSIPVAMDLYLPKIWCEDEARRSAAKIPKSVTFRTKGQLALEQVERVLSRGCHIQAVLADAGYGDSGPFRRALNELGLPYAVGVTSTAAVWRPGEGPDAPKEWSGRGRPAIRHRPGRFAPVSIRELARELPQESWQDVALRPGKANERRSRFAAVRVRTAHRAACGQPPGPQQWLIIQWPRGDNAPSHYFLSTLPSDTPLKKLAFTCKHRWRVERDYQDAKQEVGLEHYEGRRWGGFKHHLTICMAAMTYLATIRALFPPQQTPITRGRQTTTSGPSPGADRALPTV